MEIKIPYPPSVNHYYGQTKKGHRYLKGPARRYRNDVIAICKHFKADKGYGCDISLSITVNFPDNKRRDLDNLLKGILDALQHANVYKDDSLVKHLEITASSVVQGGSITVQIEPMV